MNGTGVLQRRVLRGLMLVLVCAAAATAEGCRGAQSSLDSAGVQSGRIEGLWWLYVAICGGVFVVVLGAAVLALVRPREGEPQTDVPTVHPKESGEQKAGIAVGTGLAITIVLLTIMTAGEYVVGRQIRNLEYAPDAMQIRVTGHQWWWDFEYRDAGPSQIVRSSNELHIPVGRPIKLELYAADVIHSFWVPNLHGKKDLVPGHPTILALQADKPGQYVGQCAEYCGAQHAHMRFIVVAQAPADLDAWRAAQLAPAPEPTSASATHGRDIFVSQSCVMCHTINGTTAQSRVGPDLTHIASRVTIASGTLPNGRGTLGAWIVDPQHTKPGVIMPQQSLSPSDLRDLLDYLETLK